MGAFTNFHRQVIDPSAPNPTGTSGTGTISTPLVSGNTYTANDGSVYNTGTGIGTGSGSLTNTSYPTSTNVNNVTGRPGAPTSIYTPSLSPLGGTTSNQAIASANLNVGRPGSTTTPSTAPTTGTTGYGGYGPPVTPTFAPSTYVQSTVSGFPAGYTSTQPTLDSYLRSSVNSLFNPSAVENGTAMSDPTQMLTSLAQNYLKMNPGTGTQADVQNYVNQYAKQYTDWYNQYKQYLQGNAGSISLPPGSPYATGAPQPSSNAGSPPATSNTSALTNNTQNNSQNANFQASNYLQQLMQQLLGNYQHPTYNTVKTPLGYTQYQASVPQGANAMNQLILQTLLQSLGGGGQPTGGSQNTFWNLLSGAMGGGGGTSNPATNSSGMVYDPRTGQMVFAPNGLQAYYTNQSTGIPGSF